MIPIANIVLRDIEIKRQPTKTYKMNLANKSIEGFCDNIDAMAQAVYKMLNTERFDHIIYSWNYGIEVKDLYSKPLDYVCLEIQDRITEALMQDDRITSVTDFDFEFPTKNTVLVKFTVHTIYGELKEEREVSI